jgi:hypothetical protein
LRFRNGREDHCLRPSPGVEAGLACEHPEAGRPGYFALPDSGGMGGDDANVDDRS